MYIHTPAFPCDLFHRFQVLKTRTACLALELGIGSLRLASRYETSCTAGCLFESNIILIYLQALGTCPKPSHPIHRQPHTFFISQHYSPINFSPLTSDLSIRIVSILGPSTGSISNFNVRFLAGIDI